MIRNNHSSTSLIFKESPMSLPNSSNQVASNAQRPVEAKGTNSNGPTFSRIIPAKDKRITVLSADGTKVINENEGFLDELAYHMDGPLNVYSNEYVENYNSLTYFGQPTTITYKHARSQMLSSRITLHKGKLFTSKVFPFFISKSCSDPRTMVFNIEDLCYITKHAGNIEEIREVLVTLITDFKRFTSIENDMVNPICRQKAKIANAYDDFPFSRIMVSNKRMKFPTVRLFLSDSIIRSYNAEQIEEILMELLQFVEGSGEGKQLENFGVDVSITRLSNESQEYHFHSGKNYDMSLDHCTKLEFNAENALRDIVRYGYSGSNAHPFDLCRGVVMVPFIQNFKLVTTSSDEEENNISRNIGQPPPYSQQ